MEPTNLEWNQILTIGPASWPGKPLEVQPGDLSRFAPSGLGLAVPALLRPWDQLASLNERASYYGFTAPSSHPFLNAPVNDACGGVVYFGGRPEREQIDQLLRLLDVRDATNEYAAFCAASADPMKERYLEQLRLIEPGGLTSLFGVEPLPETASLVKQKLSIRDALWQFIVHRQGKYRHAQTLQGVIGGDGDWAKEALAFGFMVENAYHGVYRIWSRAWLVTK